jgi:hypothetical protein
MIEPFSERDGWAALEIDEPQSREDEATGRHIASCFHECFRTEAGKFVLDRLINITILRPTVTPASTQFEAGIKEGRADIVRQIMVNIELAERGTDK